MNEGQTERQSYRMLRQSQDERGTEPEEVESLPRYREIRNFHQPCCRLSERLYSPLPPEIVTLIFGLLVLGTRRMFYPGVQPRSRRMVDRDAIALVVDSQE